jgi:2',3'-cyclic-nucleotide 2'-phosphodiesterase (5'-nucleotidase family)
MLDHEAMESQQEYDVIEITSPDGTNTRRVGLCAVLSDDPALYSHFKAPGAFGGATLTDPWEALAKYKALLEGPEYNCDVVVPLEHLYVPDDHKTCKMFDFPVILSGHDHHRVDETVDGTRLLKPGMNGVYSTVLELSWPNAAADKCPKVHARFVKCEDWEPDPIMEEENERAYDVLIPLRNTELARVPPSFEPLSSNGSRESVCTMGKFICSLIRSSMNVSRRQRRHQVDAVLLMGGNIRGNADYELGSFFSLEALEAEVKSDEVLAVVPMPGWLLADGVQATHAGEPIPGWMQYDEGVEEDYSQQPPVVTHVAHEPIDPNRVYRVATKISDLTNGQSPPWTEYYTEHPELLPPKGAYINIHAELMSYFARNLWRKLWDTVSDEMAKECDVLLDECNAEERLAALDLSGDGVVTVDEIQVALRDRLGYSVDDREKSLAEFVHSFADTSGDGTVTKRDIETFCREMDEIYDRDRWRLSYRKESERKIPVVASSERDRS